MDLAERFYHYQILLLKYAGFWEVSRFEKSYTAYCAIQLAWLTSFILSQLLYAYFNFDDMEKVIDAAYMFVAMVTMYIKLIFLLSRKKAFVNIVEMTANDIFFAETKEEEMICERRIKDTVTKYVVILASAYISLVMAIFGSINDPSGHMILPFKGWYPGGDEMSPNFEILFTYQVISILVGASLNISLDSLIISLMSFGCAQMEMLNHKMRVEIPEERGGGERMEDNYKTISRWAYKYQHILAFLEETERTVNMVAFIQLMTCVCASCITATQLLFVAPGSVQFMDVVLFFFAISFQSLLYFWQGNELTVSSANLGDALYSCYWIRLDEKCRKAIFIIYERLRKPIIVRCINFFELSLEVYVAIMKTSYSYFALLQSMRED